jgi:hypothetical protein
MANKRERILIKYDQKCQICFKKTNKHNMKDYPELDHKIPRSKGGSNLEENLILLCNDCNNKRSNVHGQNLINKVLNEFNTDDFLIKLISYEYRNGNINQEEIHQLAAGVREKCVDFIFELLLIVGDS